MQQYVLNIMSVRLYYCLGKPACADPSGRAVYDVGLRPLAC